MENKERRKINIFMDHQIFTMQTFGGISRVFAIMYEKFNKDEATKCELPIVFSENEYLDGVVDTKKLLQSNKSFLKTLFYYGINRIYAVYKLLKGNYDVFLPSYYDPYFLPFLKGKPFVLVLHDMTHEIFPESVSKKDKTIPWKKELVHKADRIVAISENTKKDIIKFYGVDESKIEVVYWATSIKLPEEDINLDLPKRYILFVGNRRGYKNFNTFFKGISPLLRDDKDLYLVCAGSSKFTDDEIKMIDSENVLDKVKHIRFKDDNELGSIYNKAICFVYPSLYEGFGSPILESFSCDCPILVGNTSSLPEVGGDGVEIFNSKDEKDIYNSVKRIVYNENLRQKMIIRGRERLKTFTWEKTITGYINIFNKVCKKK